MLITPCNEHDPSLRGDMVIFARSDPVCLYFLQQGGQDVHVIIVSGRRKMRRVTAHASLENGAHHMLQFSFPSCPSAVIVLAFVIDCRSSML